MSDSNNNGGSGVGVLIFLGLLWWANQPTKISMDEAIADHWSEIQNYISGTENIEACSDSGCYSLDAEIQSGSIISVHFSNGGYLSIDAEIDEDGNASDIDSRGPYCVVSTMVRNLIGSYQYNNVAHAIATRNRCADAGMPMKRLSIILGHSSTAITEQYYTHLNTRDNAAAMEKVASALSLGVIDGVSKTAQTA